jgi:hypothetical protein
MTASIKRSGARAKHGMANEGEPLLNVVIENKRKMLRCLTKRDVGGSGVPSLWGQYVRTSSALPSRF